MRVPTDDWAQTVFAMELNCLPKYEAVPDVTGIVTQEWSKLPWGLEPDRPFDDPFQSGRDQPIVQRIVRACRGNPEGAARQ